MGVHVGDRGPMGLDGPGRETDRERPRPDQVPLTPPCSSLGPVLGAVAFYL